MSECKYCKQLVMFDEDIVCSDCVQNLTQSAYATKYAQYNLQSFIDFVEDYEYEAKELIRDFCLEDKKDWIKFLIKTLGDDDDV